MFLYAKTTYFIQKIQISSNPIIYGGELTHLARTMVRRGLLDFDVFPRTSILANKHDMHTTICR